MSFGDRSREKLPSVADDPPGEGTEKTELQRFALPERRIRRTARLVARVTGVLERLVDRPLMIGSAPGADVVLRDTTVSRLHAEVTPTEDGVWIRDLASTNGTFVNGVRVERAHVPNRGVVRVGAVEIGVTYEDELETTAAWTSESFGRLLGKSRAMRELFATLQRVSSSDASVLIHGETGTGKELVARSIHDASARLEGPFVVVDCAALPETLLDAELFGHAKGAFTGAAAARAGAIEAAHGGTVFLDEIGELPLAMQPKLLRVLEARTTRRIGESEHRLVDVRFVAATHRDLLRMVSTGEFREDLYFRLSVLPVRVPALRERREDIELLAQNFLGASDALNHELLAELARRTWRGNVRELRNFVERAKALGSIEALRIADASSPPATAAATPTPAGGAGGGVALPRFAQPFRPFRDAWADAGERAYVEDLLRRFDQNVAAAARDAEIDRTYLYKLIRKHLR
jgi:DNA-binding NtrC family response regulator